MPRAGSLGSVSVPRTVTMFRTPSLAVYCLRRSIICGWMSSA